MKLKPRTTKIICGIAAGLTCLCALLYITLKYAWLSYIMLAMMVVFGVFYGVFWKCPVCKKRLDKFSDEFCPHCKAYLDE